MGLYSSCCRYDTADDHEPLLVQDRRIPSYTSDPLPHPRNYLDKLADVVAALHAGKLPSQGQVNRALRHALASDLLHPHSRQADSRPGGAEEEELNEVGKEVLDGVKDALQALLEFGTEKNDDDRLQDLVYQLRRTTSAPVHADVAVRATQPGKLDVDTIAGELPSQGEVTSDAAALLRSAYTLVYVLATSAAFRLILSDVLLVARETVADVAARVEVVAATVQKAAEDVEETVRPGKGTIEDIKGKAAEAGEKMTEELTGDGTVSQQIDELRERIQHQSPDELKAAVIRRLQEAIARAHSQPSFQCALRTILTISRKYAAKVRVAASVASSAEAPSIKVTPLVWADPSLSRALVDLKVLLERAASGYSLDPLLEALQAVVLDIVTAPTDALSESPNKTAMREWLSALGDWLDRALDDPSFASSKIGQVRVEFLYDEARRIVDRSFSDPDSQWIQHIRTLIGEVDAFAVALQKDRTTQKLVGALSKLAISFKDVATTALWTAPKIVRNRTERAKRDAARNFVLWLLPRILRAASAIPMPRVEFVNNTVEAAVDALLLTAPRGGSRGETLGVQASLVPDRIRVESWNEVVVEVDNTVMDDYATQRSSSSLMTLFAGTSRSTENTHEPEHPRTHRTQTETRTRTRARIHVEGMRVSAHDVAYYVLYKGARCCGMPLPCTSYEDEGLISVDVGELSPHSHPASAAGSGLNFDIELEFDSASSSRRDRGWLSYLTGDSLTDDRPADSKDVAESPPRPLFKVTDVRVDVPGLHISLTRSKHWLLNALLVQPLAGPLARAAVGWVLRGQIRGALEAAADLGGRLRSRARRRAARAGTEGVREGRDGGVDERSASAEDWWNALLEEVGMSNPGGGDDDDDGEVDEDSDSCLSSDEDADETEPLVETHTHATVQGVVRTTVTQASPSAEPEESVLAVGVGAQVLPGKVLEDGVEGAKVRATEEARDAVADVVRAEAGAEEGVREAVGKAVRDSHSDSDSDSDLDSEGWRKSLTRKATHARDNVEFGIIHRYIPYTALCECG
ncbi:hypothetical protein C8T65DRAFT_831795 [Cerioporus squamosus]|nr:hypothetical protein C8T65DRAFT_831795 [Cerioporus squamosus]